MDEAAYDMVAEYVNEEGLIGLKKYQGGKGGKVNMCKALEDMRTESREEGLARGIIALIEAYQEFQVSRDEAAVRLREKFGLSQECAEDYVKKYW